MRPGKFCARAQLIAASLMLSVAPAFASGPRWVTGPPYFTAPAGTPVVWYTAQPLYFTDPGDLSASVNHAAADAMVAAAAGVWNVPTSAIVLTQGGALAEHVSAANAYLGSGGPVFPTDVQAGNYAAKQIAVIYDSDGSVTDMLLGNGASAPADCRQNAVTESVDSIVPAGFIQHALLVLNGRCTGPAPEQQMQMRYQLERAFGRVLGARWSQTNDNVFTGTPQPTANQALHCRSCTPSTSCAAHTPTSACRSRSRCATMMWRRSPRSILRDRSTIRTARPLARYGATRRRAASLAPSRFPPDRACRA
jgi:hypothetical protein